tara:strand:+ start:3179 stop:3535 length:357 start_codon:yes stop_codon:yes gene_type:complete
MPAIELPAKNFATIIAATFPGYRRKTVYVRAAESVTLIDLNWSGGTRCEYRGATIAGIALGNSDKYHRLAPWDVRQVEGEKVALIPDAVLVQGGTFCGKESKLTIYVHPANMPALLPA